MIEQIYNYLTIEMLYFWVNLGVLPLWFILIFFPQSQLCKYFVTSIFPIFILGGSYIFVLYKSYLNSFDFISNFNLYFGIDDISNLFSDEGRTVRVFSLMISSTYSGCFKPIEIKNFSSIS